MKTKQIKDAFEKLSSVFYSKNQNFAEILLKECSAEERGHRGFMDGFTRSHTADTIGILDAGRLFAVKRVAEYLLSGQYPSGHGCYLHMQKSCFTAAGIADKFGPEIRTVWTPEEIAELAALDYTDFVKVKRDNCPDCEGTLCSRKQVLHEHD